MPGEKRFDRVEEHTCHVCPLAEEDVLRVRMEDEGSVIGCCDLAVSSVARKAHKTHQKSKEGCSLKRIAESDIVAVGWKQRERVMNHGKERISCRQDNDRPLVHGLIRFHHRLNLLCNGKDLTVRVG